MNIIIEADKLHFETIEEIIFSTPYHYDDPVAKACTNEIKGILENKLHMIVSVLCYKITDILINNYFNII